MTNKQATQKIYALMCEIRDIMEHLDPDTDDRYLSCTIQSNGSITFNNTYWALPAEKAINFHEELDEHED